mgnify:CR=1 FL=1
MSRILAPLLLCLGLLGCTSALDPAVQASPLGDFRLKHLVVIVDEPVQGALSRDLPDEVVKTAVTEAMATRFGRFEGKGEFSIGIKVAGYVLAQPGIPVLIAPRSMLLLNVAVFDIDQKRINPEWKRMTVFEDAGGDTVLGSGYTQSAQEQVVELSKNAAIEIEKWMRENPDWFVARPAAASPAVSAAKPTETDGNS